MIAHVIGAVVLVGPMRIAELAGAFQLLMFALVCVAVLVMRESEILEYDPGFRAPGYPWLPIIGIFAPVVVAPAPDRARQGIEFAGDRVMRVPVEAGQVCGNEVGMGRLRRWLDAG